jgi:endonuclease III
VTCGALRQAVDHEEHHQRGGPFFATLQAANPSPETELEYSSVFELLAAVLLSAQATDAGVNKATRRLFPVANTPQAILALGLEGLEDLHPRPSACTAPRPRT